jgi:error-prone DNA polymerase
MAREPEGFGASVGEEAVRGAAESRSTRPVMAPLPLVSSTTGDGPAHHPGNAGGMGRRRVLVHSSGFTMSPYADVKPPGEDAKSVPKSAPRKLWHSSPGSSGG